MLKTFGPLAAISLGVGILTILSPKSFVHLTHGSKSVKINYESIHKYFDKEHQIIENGWKKI